jgi:PHD/YefM family antitoxin component YafN of YafNO toxin-antitoxin module
MLEINKKLIIDENQNPVAVIISIEELKKIETILEDYGLAKLMEQAENDEVLSYEEAINYYKSLKNVES